MTKNIANKTKVYGDNFTALLMDSPKKMISSRSDYPDGLSYPFHQHPPIQFLYASEGVMTVTTRQGVWVVPNFRAVWIPSNTWHKIDASGRLGLRSVYIKPEVIPDPPSQCFVASVSPLLRELLLYASQFPVDYQAGSLEERILVVILDLIRTLDTRPLLLPTPKDPRLRRITEALTKNPADGRSLEEWGKVAGATGRTLTRLFGKETGMSFRQWRQQARLLEALRQLASGETVSTVALNLGYESVSAFISMFRRTLGSTPGQYFNDAG